MCKRSFSIRSNIVIGEFILQIHPGQQLWLRSRQKCQYHRCCLSTNCTKDETQVLIFFVKSLWSGLVPYVCPGTSEQMFSKIFLEKENAKKKKSNHLAKYYFVLSKHSEGQLLSVHVQMQLQQSNVMNNQNSNSMH